MQIINRKIFKYQVHDAVVYWIVVPVLVIGSGKGIDFILQLPSLQISPYGTVGAITCICAGFVLIWRAMKDFYLYGKGTPNPRFPPRVLVRGGVYSICRHPMFFGYDLAALGVCLLSHSPAALIVSCPVFLVVQIRFLLKEETFLARRYRAAFEEYKKQVPFLVPLPRTIRS